MSTSQTKASSTPPTATHETAALISSDKVAGTAVFRSRGDKIGRIESLMINKRSGQVAYAVMSFGGFLGIGEDHYPLPWKVLTYNERLGGYELNMTDDQLKDAPHYNVQDGWDWDDPEHGRKMKKHYEWVFI